MAKLNPKQRAFIKAAIEPKLTDIERVRKKHWDLYELARKNEDLPSAIAHAVALGKSLGEYAKANRIFEKEHKMFNFLSGRKTYLVALAVAIIAGMNAVGIPTPPWVEPLAIALGLGTLRAGVGKTKKTK